MRQVVTSYTTVPACPGADHSGCGLRQECGVTEMVCGADEASAQGMRQRECRFWTKPQKNANHSLSS